MAFRRRIEALERRLASSVGGLDAAVQELDAAVIAAGARLDEAEAVTGETAEALRNALADLGANIAALRKRLTDVEDGAEELLVVNDDAHGDLDRALRRTGELRWPKSIPSPAARPPPKSL